MRLDQLCSNRFKISRNRARDLIAAGKITLNSIVVCKPSHEADDRDLIEIDDRENFVSRSALKLLYFLDASDLNINGLNCLDIGASTGGWTEVLLLRGAAQVTAIDIGVNQFAPAIKNHEKVISLEKTDIRLFRAALPFDLVVCDASFISLEKIIDSINLNAKDHIILLFKPQFEAGRAAKRTKRGVVIDQKATISAMIRFESAAAALGWRQIEKRPAQIKGREGNLEYLFYFRKTPS